MLFLTFCSWWNYYYGMALTLPRLTVKVSFPWRWQILTTSSDCFVVTWSLLHILLQRQQEVVKNPQTCAHRRPLSRTQTISHHRRRRKVGTLTTNIKSWQVVSSAQSFLVLINSYSASHDNWCTVGGDVGSARYEPALLPPCPTIMVLSYSN